jgi:ABC-type transport system substrate-binding protein
LSAFEVSKTQSVEKLWSDAPSRTYAAVRGSYVRTGCGAQLLTRWLSVDPGASWTLSLRPGGRFSDGAAFDAEAVRFNWARLADPVQGEAMR